MNTPPRDRDAGYYRIRVKGHLAPRWATRFDGMSLTQQDDGTTLIQGLVVDQAALHGLLQQVRDTGLPLVSVAQTHEPDPEQRTTTPR
jgi:hypothetical protein